LYMMMRKGELNMLKKQIPALLLLLCLLFTASAQADKYGYAVDIDTMKALEAQSAFPVKVTEKKIVQECFERRSDFNIPDSPDALVVTVTNQSDQTLTGVQVGFIALNAEGLTTDVVRSTSLTISLSNDPPEIKTLARDDLSLAPGESCIISLRVDYERVRGVRAMVSEYTTAEGTVANPDFPLWQTYAFGLGSSNSTELD